MKGTNKDRFFAEKDPEDPSNGNNGNGGSSIMKYVDMLKEKGQSVLKR